MSRMYYKLYMDNTSCMSNTSDTILYLDFAMTKGKKISCILHIDGFKAVRMHETVVTKAGRLC